VRAEVHDARSGGEWPWFTGAWLLATAAVTFAPGASEWAEWTRRAGVAGTPVHESIRSFLTCHFAHYGTVHWLWNALALGITGFLAERAGRRALVAATLLAVLAIPLALPFADPSLVRYRGASGIASAWFTLALVRQWQRCGATSTRAVLAVAAAIYVAKLISEAATGSSWFVGHGVAGFDNVPFAHVIGTACGFISAAIDASTRTRTGSFRQVFAPAFLTEVDFRVRGPTKRGAALARTGRQVVALLGRSA